MSAREWTGSVAVLPQAMRELAVEFMQKANQSISVNSPLDASDALELGRIVDELNTFLQAHAYTLSEWADAVEQLYARLDAGEGVTNAQGVAVARLLRNADSVLVSRVAEPGGSTFLGFTQTYRDGRRIYGGIEPDGSVHT